ncbi:DUF1127 domain-containing protein [Rhodopila globiformis]|uniref:YjiS-like domain-containing protein n=1 Tax=Rhodopila globiformis TaxID=1071 RepID=A0A2S6MXF3_RHOGL|nr:DUF1127 domain-containing protein [Rhodopila globiformis]PPQ27028.1 hypothetical protein CCS01_28230 [Rhodopila globiformis]
MSVQTADSQFSFKLPSLSYIDARWEEPELLAPAAAPGRRTGLAAWLSARVAAFQAWRRDREAAAELASMSSRDLMDIGLTRSDLSRVFDPACNDDLRTRGARR